MLKITTVFLDLLSPRCPEYEECPRDDKKILGLDNIDITETFQFPSTRRELLDKLQVRVVVFPGRIEVNAVFPIDPIVCQKYTFTWQGDKGDRVTKLRVRSGEIDKQSQRGGKEISMKITFIGGGNMGEAMLTAILTKGLSSKGAITVSDISESRREYLEQKYGVSVTSDNHEAIGGVDVVILAIKPQQLAEVMAGLNEEFRSPQLVLSIIAGARIGTLCRGLGYRQIVRVMPNAPAQIGEGMSVWAATAEVTREQRKWAGSILGAMGKEIYVDDEKYIDMATAVSGSGPAYVFLFAEALVEAAVHIGLAYDVAQELVQQTILGSAHFMQRSDKLPAELRRMVTSPGGTTAEALAELEKGQFAELIKQAVTAAYNRAKELDS